MNNKTLPMDDRLKTIYNSLRPPAGASSENEIASGVKHILDVLENLGEINTNK